MASYHFSAQLIQRSKGRSAVAAAAYRSGTVLVDNRTGQRHDFSRRRGVVSSEILTPDGTPAFLGDRQALWNHVEAIERRQDAQVAREINLALPHELDARSRREMLLRFVKEAFVDLGMVADVCIHAPVREKGDDPRQHHAHVMLTMRLATSKGLHRVKTREWNSEKLLEEWRELWSVRQNEALARLGRRERVDHRSLLAQKHEALNRRDYPAAVKLDRKPQIHIGPRARAATKRGIQVQTRDREVGPKRRQKGELATRSRVIRYSAIDRGTRFAQCQAIAKENWTRRRQAIGKWQVRSSRFRARQEGAVRLEELARVNFRHLFNQRNEWRWLEGREQVPSLACQVKEAVKRLGVLKKRRALLARLIAEVDRTLAGLLLSQARETKPFRRLQSKQPRALGLRPGRSRARCPIGPSIRAP